MWRHCPPTRRQTECPPALEGVLILIVLLVLFIFIILLFLVILLFRYAQGTACQTGMSVEQLRVDSCNTHDKLTKLITLVNLWLPGPCVFLRKPTFASRKALRSRQFVIVACFLNPLAKVEKPGDESRQRCSDVRPLEGQRLKQLREKLSAPSVPP